MTCLTWKRRLKPNNALPVDLSGAESPTSKRKCQRMSSSLVVQCDSRDTCAVVGAAATASTMPCVDLPLVASTESDHATTDATIQYQSSGSYTSSSSVSGIGAAVCSRRRGTAFANHSVGVDKKEALDSTGLPNLLERRGVAPTVAERIVAAANGTAVSRARLRAVLWNLGRNSQLRDSVNKGVVSSMQLLAMSDDELATAARKQQRQQFVSEALDAVVLKDVHSFYILCKGCGNCSATGVVVSLGGNQYSCGGCEGGARNMIRGNCNLCGLIWLDGHDDAKQSTT